MKGFSEAVESICRMPEIVFDAFLPEQFESLTVEPVPSVGNMPKQLRNSEMLQAMYRHHREHIERIEREGRG